MKYKFKTRGTCSTEINFDINNNIITNISFNGGCNGNLKTISRLLEGFCVDEIVEKCSGIVCDKRSTSCVGELVRAVKKAKEDYQIPPERN